MLLQKLCPKGCEELEDLQEAITLVVFVVFAWLALGEPLRARHAVALGPCNANGHAPAQGSVRQSLHESERLLRCRSKKAGVG